MRTRRRYGDFFILYARTNYQARHIASEKKRRETIRLAFDRIVELVPDLTPAESRTEVAVLSKSANFIDQLRTENLKLIELLQQEKVEIPDHLVEAFSKPPQQAPSYDKK